MYFLYSNLLSYQHCILFLVNFQHPFWKNISSIVFLASFQLSVLEVCVYSHVGVFLHQVILECGVESLEAVVTRELRPVNLLPASMRDTPPFLVSESVSHYASFLLYSFLSFLLVYSFSLNFTCSSFNLSSYFHLFTFLSLLTCLETHSLSFTDINVHVVLFTNTVLCNVHAGVWAESA